MTIDEMYPSIASWIGDGCIEIGSCDSCAGVTLRAVDQGGTAWETDEPFATLEAALDALEAGIAAWYEEIGVE